MSKASEKRELKERAMADLKAQVKPGSLLILRVTHVSRSGMMAHVSCELHTKDGLVNLGWHLEHALGYSAASKYSRDVKVGGCGFSRTLHVADHVAHALGFKLNQSECTRSYIERNGKTVEVRKREKYEDTVTDVRLPDGKVVSTKARKGLLYMQDR